MRVGTLLAEAARRLRQRFGAEVEARLEAALLVGEVLQVGRAWLVAHDDALLDLTQVQRLEGLLARRLAGEPLAYILGVREFFGRRFRVNPAVLIPRPETEHLVEAALARLPAASPCDVLDLCTGSGCVAISLRLARSAWRLAALDCSGEALAVARDNGGCLGAKVEWLQGDLFEAVVGRRFDAVVANPPYVAEADPHLDGLELRHEPRLALVAGDDGLATIRRILEQVPTYLRPGGWLLLEHGWQQGEAVRAGLAGAGLVEIFSDPDLAGHPRVSGGRLPGTSPAG